jgi:hypothetical protein
MFDGKIMKKFDDLRFTLHVNEEIKNWTKLKGEFGENFVISDINPNYIVVMAPSAQMPQIIPRKDFDAILPYWEDYCQGIFKRSDFLKITRYSKYIISILHHCDNAT